jgi:hypothetical protein
MKPGLKLKIAGATLTFTGLVLTSMFVNSPRGRTHAWDHEESRIEQGFDIAQAQMIKLTFDERDRNLVGLGSYIVNTEGCNDCHSAGPMTQYAPGGDPYFGQKKQINLKTYLGGGRDFGKVSGPPSPDIISRNLTPTPKTGLPGGDITLDRFLEIFGRGTDFDHLHPNCSATITTNCFPPPSMIPPIPPVDGNLLQVMPWPNFQDLVEHDKRAIYEYLKAVPCIQGNYPGPGGPGAGIPPEPADRCQ